MKSKVNPFTDALFGILVFLPVAAAFGLIVIALLDKIVSG